MEAPRQMRFREGVLVAAGLLGLIGLQMAATGSTNLLHKNFWLDELYSYALATDADQLHAMRALQGAVDTNPPALGLMLFVYTTVAGSASELVFRSFALGAMVLALLGIYAVVRLGYSALVASAATLAVWGHPLVQHHAYEVRFYGPWLAAAVWFCYLLARARGTTPGRWKTAALALCSIALCTIHYFGVLTLLIIVGVEWAWSHGRPGYARSTIAAAATGPLALVIAAALFLPHQRSALPNSSWADAPSFAAIANLGLSLFLPLHLGGVVFIAWLSGLWPAGSGSVASREPAPRDVSGLIGLTGLALLFPALIAFSYLVQPALISRYAITAVAPIAPAVAFSASRMTRPWVLLLIGFFVVASGYQLGGRGRQARAEDARTRQLIEAIRHRADGRPVLFEVPHRLYVVWHYAPDLRGQVFLLDFENGQLGNQVSRFRVVTRDTARQFAKFYDAAGLMPWDDVRRADAIYLVPDGEAWSGEPLPGERYAGFVMEPVGGELYKLVRVAPGADVP